MAKRKGNEAGSGSDSGENGSGQSALIPDVETGRVETEAIDPVSLGESPESRTRKPRSDAGTKRIGRPRKGAAEKESAENLTGILLSIHVMGATLLHAPEWELSEDEAAKLAAAIARVNELYNGLVLPEKAAAWVQLVIVAGTIYGPRVMVSQMKPKAEKESSDIPLVFDMSAAVHTN